MSTIVLRLPDVKCEEEQRPTECPYCGVTHRLQRWGRCAKPVRDNKLRVVMVRRYRCCACGRSFRHYPEGVSRSHQTGRMVRLAALMWALGLSLRGVEAVLGAFGVDLGRSTIARDGKAIGEQVRGELGQRQVRVLGVDGAWLPVAGKKQGIMVAVDMGSGVPVRIAAIDENDVLKVKTWLQEVVRELDVAVLVTDDANAYRPMAQHLGLERQICQFHMLRWVNRELARLARLLGSIWQEVIRQVQQIVRELPVDGGARLFQLWHRIKARPPGVGEAASPLYQLKRLLIRLSDHWTEYRLFQEQEQVPNTNNRTERAIGKLKQRSRTVRGWKTSTGVESMFYLLATR